MLTVWRHELRWVWVDETWRAEKRKRWAGSASRLSEVDGRLQKEAGWSSESRTHSHRGGRRGRK